MAKRGRKPRTDIRTVWSPELAYAVGLIAADGCLAGEGYLIDLTSKDKEQLHNFSKCLGIPLKIGVKKSGYNATGKYYRIQFKGVLFYNFLVSIGLTPAKSRTLSALKIPNKYFYDFLRGSFDGDGCTYSYWDPRWRSSFMYYLCFTSASKAHVTWIQKTAYDCLGVKGHITTNRSSSFYQLKYAKTEAMKLLEQMYKDKSAVFLSRKKLKIDKMLRTIGQHIKVAKA